MLLREKMPLSDSQNPRKSPRRMDIRCRCNDDDMYLTSYANSSAFDSCIFPPNFVTSKGSLNATKSWWKTVIEDDYSPQNLPCFCSKSLEEEDIWLQNVVNFLAHVRRIACLHAHIQAKWAVVVVLHRTGQYISYNCMMRYDLEWIDMDLTFSITI